jgi:3-methyladenine DNA glycosylase AlkC
MAELLKDFYNERSLRSLGMAIKEVNGTFPVDNFINQVIDSSWDSLELKARTRKISLGMATFLPQNYQEAIAILSEAITKFDTELIAWPFPDFVEVYGQNESDWETSMRAMAHFTCYASAEFTVRPFIIT